MNFQPASVCFEPFPDSSIFMIRSIVLNEMNLAAMIDSGDPLEKPKVGLGIEDFIPIIQEASCRE